MSQNSCAEEMIMTAARISRIDNIQFGGQAKNDHQVQLPLYIPEMSIFDNDRNMFQSFINGLDKKKAYFLRTGKYGGLGHWQLLHFIPENGWQLYSTENNKRMLTQHSVLTEDGAYQLLGNPKGTAKWGDAPGNYAIYLWEANPLHIINCANFLCAFRSSSEDVQTCEYIAEKFMEQCDGKLASDHPYLANSKPSSVSVYQTNLTDLESNLDGLFRSLSKAEFENYQSIVLDCIKHIENPNAALKMLYERLSIQIQNSEDKNFKQSMKKLYDDCKDMIKAQMPAKAQEASVVDKITLKNKLFMVFKDPRLPQTKESLIEEILNSKSPLDSAKYIHKLIKHNKDYASLVVQNELNKIDEFCKNLMSQIPNPESHTHAYEKDLHHLLRSVFTAQDKDAAVELLITHMLDTASPQESARYIKNLIDDEIHSVNQPIKDKLEYISQICEETMNKRPTFSRK